MDESSSRLYCDSTKSLGCLGLFSGRDMVFCQNCTVLAYALGGCLVEIRIANMLLQPFNATIISATGLRVLKTREPHVT
jgi:hypothetical protein